MFINYEGQLCEIVDREFDYFTKNWLYVVEKPDHTLFKIVMNPAHVIVPEVGIYPEVSDVQHV